MARPTSLAPLLLIVAACASGSWRTVQQQDTALAYRGYLRENPEGDHADAAWSLLSEREFEAASAQHSVLAYKRYLEEFPHAPRSAAARALLEGLRFNAAAADGKVNALRHFLREHPEGGNREEAERLLVEAEFAEQAGADPERLARLARSHPDDPRRLEVEARLDQEAFTAAKESDSAFAYYAYLRDFAAGAHRQQAQAQLFALRLKGLLVSGRLEQALGEKERSPLAAGLDGLGGWFEQAEAVRKLAASRDQAVQAAMAGHYLRDKEDLERALLAQDALDRWQAAEELGHHVSIEVLDPLLVAVRTARNPLVRQRAFDSLRRVVGALPLEVAQYELATRLMALRPSAQSEETWLALAVLLDLSGRLPEAAAEYQRAWDGGSPDPVVLRRWIEIRRLRGQPFSMAVAARQLALWAGAVVSGQGHLGSGAVALGEVRQLCAAAVNARLAVEVISAARGEVTDFPDDLVRFEVQAKDVLRLTEARLLDAELQLRAQEPRARTCADAGVAERVAEGEQLRAQALRRLAGRPGGDPARGAIDLARERDPSEAIRKLAAGLID